MTDSPFKGGANIDIEVTPAMEVGAELVAEPGQSHLPWGAYRERIDFPDSVTISTNTKSGEFILQTLFGEFTVLAEKKIAQVLDSTDQQKPLSKSLQRGEDTSFDQLLNSLNSVAEHCLPSLLTTLFQWYERQIPPADPNKKAKPTGEKDFLVEKRELAIEFIFLMVLIEVLKQLPYHPGHDELVTRIVTHSFKHFKYKEGTQSSPNAMNMNIIADLSAEVMGVLAQSKFMAVRKYFISELKELRAKEQNPFNTQAIISLLMGMKFFRVKMHPIEEFQASIQFLQECGNYFLDVKDKDIKHALAGLFVEILLPVAAVVKNEVNVPVLKNFVEMLYSSTLDIANKKKHSLALFPMVTCLLCVSQKQFFLNNWPYFLTMCLSHLKDRDPKMARVALESLYRLLWVYMIRIKCESNTATNSRLQSIVNSLFPKGSKVVVPRDTPLNIFVKIIQFIGQERLDFAMREIIYDLLYVGRPIRYLTPERMSIGLRSFLVIADSLQRKEADPPMPQTMGVMPSGNTLRFKKTFINKYLSDDTAKMIGMAAYYPHVRKAFDSILRLLDSQVGKPMLMTKTENVNREPEEIITGERKPKIDLFRTCVAAVPRLLPEGMSQHELIELLSRLTVHMDDELGKLAFQSMQNIVVDLPEWRNDVLRGFVQFIQKEVNDTFPQLLDQCNRRLISLLTQWKTVAQNAQANKERLEKQSAPSAPVSHHLRMTERFHGPQTPLHLEQRQDHKPLTASKEQLVAHRVQREHGHQRATLHELEGFALVMLCSCKPIVRKLAVVILKEVRNLFTLLNIPKDTEPCVLDVMDRSCPVVIERVLPYLPQTEKAAALSASPLDFQWLADRTSIIWTSAGYHDMNDNSSGHSGGHSGSSSSSNRFEAWIECMSIFMHHEYVMGHCPTAVNSAWPILYGRLQALFIHVDPNNTVNESRTSSILGRPGSKKLTNERDLYMNLWQNYVVMGCCIAPSASGSDLRSASPELTSSPDSTNSERLEMKSPGAHVTAKDLFKTLVPLIRCDVADMRETVVIGLGRINPEAFRDLTEELVPIIKEAIDRKQENVRRRKRRDMLRLALVRIFRCMAQHGIFAQSPAGVIDQTTNALSMTFVEYIEGARLFLENEGEKELPILQDIRLHFAEFCRHLIRNTPIEMRGKLLSRDLRYSLFYLFASWSGKFGSTFGAIDKRAGKGDRCNELELTAVQAMSAVLCCGSVFDPSGLNDDGYIYSWLDTLLGAHDEKIKSQIYKLAQETVVLLLEFNPDAQALLDWVIDRCYTGSHEVADGCFNALASVFNNREYPCDHVAMLNVTLLNTGCPRIAIHETAVQLLHLLYKRFFLDDVCMATAHPDDTGEGADAFPDPLDEAGAVGEALLALSNEEDRKALQDMLLSGPYSRSQIWLSETLARLHPELTMPIFSEITHRFQTAVPALRQVLLQYLLPWLYNMELVDPNVCNPLMNFLNKLGENRSMYAQPFLRGDGWGSPQATEMVLNNLMYITCKFGDDHAKEIEDLWAALVACWPGNLKVIIRYIIIITGMAPTNLLPYTKRVVVYLSRAKPEHVVDEMMNELQTVEALTFNVERTQTPPFYRLTSIRTRASTTTVLECSSEPETAGHTMVLDKGQIHTKRHSGEDPSKIVSEMTPRANSSPSLKSESSTTSSVAPSVKTATDSELEIEGLNLASLCSRPSEQRRPDTPLPYPLPMPAYGGFFAPLSELLPDGNLPNPPYQRCNLAVMLMTDLIVDGIDIDWTIHLPHILHIIFLGLDNSRSLIHEHCKKLLLNLLLVLPAHNDHFSVAKILLSNKAANEDTSLTLPNAIGKDFKFIEGAEGGEPGPVAPPNGGRKSLGSGTLATDSVSSLVDVDLLPSTEDVAKALIEFLVTRKCRPLWSYEDITAKVHSIRSAEQLEHFLRYSLRIFNESLPQAHTEQRWALVALQLALCCSSRHYAGRSFQVFRALHVPLTTQMLSDILSRLVETVAEQGEDMQGYVTEIILTLEAAVDNLNVDFRPIDFVKELFMSTPNLNKEPRLEVKKSATVALRQSAQHYRSTSYSLANVVRRPLSTVSPIPAVASSPMVLESKVKPRRKLVSTSDIEDPPKMQTHWKNRTRSLKEARQHRVSTGELDTRKNTNLSRSRSAQSLKQLQDPTGHDDKLTILTQMFWIAVSLLESDYEHEFLLAVRLLDKILKHIQPDRPECREKLDKILQQMMWPSFPGVQALLLKGCTSPVTAEPTWNLLAKLTLCINAPVIDPSQCVGFPLNVIALLPYLVEHYEDNNKVCTEAADHISQMCMEQTGKLDNLATVMTLYSRGVFGKDNFQWTKCVIKYLYDVYSNLSANMITFLVEVLDKGPTSTQSAVLQILHCIIHYIDVVSAPTPLLNAELFRVVSKYVEGPYWREAVKILKLCVTRSSTLSAPPPSMMNMSISILDVSLVSLPSHTSFAEAEVSFKKELPGRTIDFSFDVSQAKIIGKKHLDMASAAHEGETSEKDKAEAVSDKVSQITTTTTSSSQSSGDVIVFGWRKPQLSQARTRERLVNLLTSYGQRVGLPKSPSVIFSQSSDTIERQASMCSSSEEASLAEGDKMDDDSSADQQFQVFKDFDFLDIELDEMESDGVDKFNWGVKRHSPSLEEAEGANEMNRSAAGSLKEDSSDDEERAPSVSPMDEYPLDLATSSTITLQNTVMLDPTTRQRSSPLSGSSHSIHSAGSDADMADLSPCHASPNFSNMAVLCIQGDEIEDIWRSHVNRVMTDSTATYAVNTFHLFARLLQETQRKLQTLTKEACYFLSKTDSVRGLAHQLSSVLELMSTDMECPLVYADVETLTACKMIERHKFSILEIHESYETYLLRKEQANECLDGLKSSVKYQSLGDGTFIPDFCGDEQKVELCRCLYKLHFQVLQLFEGYSKLVDSLARATKPPQVVDLSEEVMSLREDLQRAQAEVEADQEALSYIVDVNTLSRDDAEKLLIDSVTSRQFVKAVVAMRNLRPLFPGDMFGVNPTDEVEGLLFIYCKHQAEAKPGVVAITKSNHDLSEVCTRLMDIKVQLSVVIAQIEQQAITPTAKIEHETLMKLPESSTL